jgi:hypothetical protein
MRHPPPRWFTGTLLAIALTLVGGSALAYFTGDGLGRASAAVTQLSAPTIASATPGAGGTVALAWSSVSPPGPETVKYYVTRDGGDPAGNCAAPAVPAAATSCNDGGVSVGTHSYRVTAIWRSWSATSAVKTATVAVGEATHFTLTAATTAPAVGAADKLTITARDANENVVATYSGSHSLVFSGASSSPSGAAPTVVDSAGTAVNFGSPTALTFTAGVAAVASAKNGVMKLYKAAASSILASESSTAVTTKTPLGVTPTPLAATKYALTSTTATPTAGAVGNNLTITAQDTYGNTATAYTGSHSLVFAGASAAPGGTVPTVSNSSGVDIAFGTATAIGFSAGVASASGVANGEITLYKSGAAGIKATEGSITNATALALTVGSAAAAKLGLSAATTTPVAAAPDDLMLTASDAYGNTATAYAGAKNITFSGASSSPSGAAPTVVDSAGTAVNFGSPTALTFTAGVAAAASATNGVMKLNHDGAAAVAASDGTFTTPAVAFTVSTGAPTRLAISSPSASAGTIGSPCVFTCTVTKIGNGGALSANVAATDGLGNVVSELGSGHTAKITASTGSLAEGTLTLAATGPAISATRFTFTAPVNGNFTATVTIATLAGTAYTGATATVTK